MLSNGLPQTRRTFLASAAVTSLGAAVGVSCAPMHHASSSSALFPEGQGGVLLFQGDSITDSGRSRKTADKPNETSALGSGYPLYVAGALLGERQDGSLQIYNRGISGNKVSDLKARWETDTLALKPDVLSILIGINDYWHRRSSIGTGSAAPVIKEYEEQYTALLSDTRKALPNIRILVLEPFVLKCGGVDDSWFPAVTELQKAAARVASAAGATFVPLQEVFDKCSQRTKPQDWAADGIHPTLSGHSVIAHQWLKALS